MTISSSPIKKLNFYANWFRPQTTLNFIEENLVYPVSGEAFSILVQIQAVSLSPTA